MSIKTVEIRVCDSCGKQIEGRLIVHNCPCCKKEFCNECYAKANTKRQPKEPKGKKAKAGSLPPPINESKTENFTFSILPDDKGYQVVIAGSSATGATPRLAIQAALESFKGVYPPCLTEDERTRIQEILDAGEDK